tara:strand:+ start:1666 stop:2382 length:717 start_codon:yes stop_codon:yes gene_type:complete
MNKLSSKIINYITLAILFSISIFALIYSLKSDLYRLEKINIKGNNFIKNTSIKNLLKENINKNILSLNLGSINNKINNNEFIESSKIYTTFPSTICIIINEVNPIALIDIKSKYYFIDNKYKQIHASLESINHYSVPIVSMENINNNDIMKIADILKIIITTNYKLYEIIDEINVKENFVYMIINNQTKIQLSKNYLINNTYKLIEFIADKQIEDKIHSYKYVNVSIPKQIIVKERKI